MMKHGSKFKENASNFSSSLLSYASSSSDSMQRTGVKPTHRRGKSKQSIDLFGEIEPGYRSTQRNYFTQEEQSRFSDQSVEQLEHYALSKSKDTTSSIKNAIKIAEETKGVATHTMEALSEQGETLRRTHETAANVEDALGRGEKLLGSLGGIFSMTWKPKKSHKITGPQNDLDQYKRKINLKERAGLGLKGETRMSKPDVTGLNGTQTQLEMEKHTQDEALSDLSNVLVDLKSMTLDMGSEIDRQNYALDRMHDDVIELVSRVEDANNRARRLIHRF